MTTIQLEDLIPQEARFTLASTGKTYRVKPFSLQDDMWLNRTYGADLEKILRDMRWVEIARIVFHQLHDEDRAEFAKQTVTIVNEQGERINETIGGVDLMFRMIHGYADKKAMYDALLEALGLSKPIQEKLLSGDQKKSLVLQVGQTSSTDSQASTDGQPSTSSHEQDAK